MHCDNAVSEGPTQRRTSRRYRGGPSAFFFLDPKDRASVAAGRIEKHGVGLLSLLSYLALMQGLLSASEVLALETAMSDLSGLPFGVCVGVTGGQRRTVAVTDSEAC